MSCVGCVGFLCCCESVCCTGVAIIVRTSCVPNAFWILHMLLTFLKLGFFEIHTCIHWVVDLINFFGVCFYFTMWPCCAVCELLLFYVIHFCFVMSSCVLFCVLRDSMSQCPKVCGLHSNTCSRFNLTWLGVNSRTLEIITHNIPPQCNSNLNRFIWCVLVHQPYN